MKQVLREEKKYIIGIDEYMNKRFQLSKLLIQDKHNDIDGYIVRSLYFDNIYDTDFEDNVNGIETRKKIRLRIYDTSSDYAFLEMKQKQGIYQKKRSVRIKRDDALSIIKADYSPLLSYDDEFAAECYAVMSTGLYRPRIIIQYKRYAFVARENNIRVTFDREISATESNFELFSDKLCLTPVIDSYYVIMEVKYNGFLLSYIQQMLNSIDRMQFSASKYCIARKRQILY